MEIDEKTAIELAGDFANVIGFHYDCRHMEGLFAEIEINFRKKAILLKQEIAKHPDKNVRTQLWVSVKNCETEADKFKRGRKQVSEVSEMYQKIFINPRNNNADLMCKAYDLITDNVQSIDKILKNFVSVIFKQGIGREILPAVLVRVDKAERGKTKNIEGKHYLIFSENGQI
jgi:hypothetical protein